MRLGKFERHRVGAIAVCLLWSFLNPVHERRTRELLAERLPGTPVWLSSEVCSEIREYERTSTTVVNGYVAEAFAAHQDRLEGYLQSEGFGGEIRYLQSNGGLAGGRIMREQPVAALFSGPAAGPAAGLVFAEQFRSPERHRRRHGRYELRRLSGDGRTGRRLVASSPSADTGCAHRQSVSRPSVRAGGSIATVDRGLLAVGPGSAGAEPGPACYDRGGTQATVTDANLLLGYINAEALLGGALSLSPERAAQAVRRHVADPLGLSVERAGPSAMFEVVNRNMADALRAMTLGIGRDSAGLRPGRGRGSRPGARGRACEDGGHPAGDRAASRGGALRLRRSRLQSASRLSPLLCVGAWSISILRD